jgi:hypothetical protein
VSLRNPRARHRRCALRPRGVTLARPLEQKAPLPFRTRILRRRPSPDLSVPWHVFLESLQSLGRLESPERHQNLRSLQSLWNLQNLQNPR